MLYKFVEDQKGIDAPTHVAVIFDAKGKTFRSDIYPDYKANRPPAPEDLVPQFPLTRDATRAFNLSCIEQAGLEADDIIATLATQARDRGGRVTIISSDKDLMQLVGNGVDMLDAMKNKRIDSDGVFEKFGVKPDRVIDVQSLAGDSVDNVPGAPGIGVKTAALLINEYGDLDSLLERASEIKLPKRKDTLINFADQIRISRIS
jgi:5''-3'' exonuclease (including N-terminal domain of PolI)